MQGQGSSTRFYSETYEFDQGSSSNTSVMDQGNLLLNPSEGQNTPSHLLSPSDAHMFCKNMMNQETSRLSMGKSGGSCSTEHPEVEGSHDEEKRKHGWMSSLPINIEDGSRREGRPSEVLGATSLENMNLDLNINQVDYDQPYDHFEESVNVSRQDLEPGTNPFSPNTGWLPSEHFFSSDASSSTFASSSKGIDLLPEVGGRQASEVYGRRLSGKRKNVEIMPGESSGCGSSSARHQSENIWLSSVPALQNAHNNLERSTSTNNTGLHPTIEQRNQRIESDTRPMSSGISDSHSFGNVNGSAEYFHRNTRMRINPEHENVIERNLWSQENSSQLSAQQQYSSIIPVHQLEDSTLPTSGVSLHSYSPARLFPGLPQNLPHPFTSNGTSDARIGALGFYTNSTNIGGEVSNFEDSNSTSMARNNISEHQMFSPPTNNPNQLGPRTSPNQLGPPISPNQLVEDSTTWHLTSGSRSLPGRFFPTSQVGTRAGTRQPLRSYWVPHQGPSQNHQSLQEVLRRSLLSYAGSRSQSQSAPLQQHAYSSASHVIGNEQSGAGSGGHQQSYLSSVLTMDMQNDGPSNVPLSTRTPPIARDRSRRILEIRDVLDRIRRGRFIRYEDTFILGSSVPFGGGNLHDRHRDMRLDVDNMSYEELLALEERIGNVNTGLSEETIMKFLKQKKYAPIALEPVVEAEPCCICQEEYVEEEELGTLDCGHDFHTSCIKQWLMLKNLCPICKTTALNT